jgi:large subunit ribosomal protein L13
MSTTTVRLKASQISKDWHVIDAAGRPLGRVAAEAAALLRGKHKPAFEPHLDAGDFVIIVNAAKVRLSGNKEQQVRYYRHSGFPGGLKSRTFAEQMEKSPETVIEKAVWGMLPGGPLGKKMLRHLKVYKRADHPHESQITGSERARKARDEAVRAAIAEVRKPRRLAPLPVPDPVKAEVEIPAAPAAPRRTRTRTVKPVEAAPVAEAVEAAEPVAEVGTAAPPPAEAPVEAPAAEAPKPRRRTAAKTETAAAEAAATTDDAPKPRRRAAAKATPEGDATTEKKPRSRKKAETEES